MCDPNPAAQAKCHSRRTRRGRVGKFYALATGLILHRRKNSGNLPFLRIGTRIATISASTWFHAKNQRGGERFSGPAAAPFLLFGRRSEELLELAAFEHFHHDVGAADEFAADVELRDRRPVAIGLDALPDLGVL